jgi:GTP-binding protein
LRVTAEFVTSAASAAGFPRDGLPEVAMVGRSNVGKSSLINALVRRRLARTSAAPGKTRLVNLYRIARERAAPFYLVDLPGYGYARGGRDAEDEFEALTRAYFGRETATALLLVDARHPGLPADRAAWQWIQAAVDGAVGVVATKIDKLARGERIRAMRELESVFEASVLPVSAVTGEGLDETWKLIDRLANSHKPTPGSRPAPTAPPPPATRPPRPRRS